jgi:hypothetical protein
LRATTLERRLASTVTVRFGGLGVGYASLLRLPVAFAACASAVAAMKAIRASLTAFCIGSLVVPSNVRPVDGRRIKPFTCASRDARRRHQDGRKGARLFDIRLGSSEPRAGFYRRCSRKSGLNWRPPNKRLDVLSFLWRANHHERRERIGRGKEKTRNEGR